MEESIHYTTEINTNEGVILVACVGLDNDSFHKFVQTFFPREGYGILRLDSLNQVDNNSFGIPEVVVVPEHLSITEIDDRIITVTNEELQNGDNRCSLSEETSYTTKDRNGNKVNISFLESAVDVISNMALNRRRKKLYSERINDIKAVLNNENGIDVDRLLDLFASKDATALGHIKTVAKLTDVMALGMDISEEMGSLSEQQKEDFRTIALIHDIGKLVTPDQLLKNKGAFVGQEYERMKEHVEINYELAESEKTQELLSVALQHHYNFNGVGGYLAQGPDEIGENIPLMARLMRVVDSFDAISDPGREYQKIETGKSLIEKAVNLTYSLAGTQFDPKAAQAFLLGFREKFMNDPQFQAEWLEREHMAQTSEERKIRVDAIEKVLNNNIINFNERYGFIDPMNPENNLQTANYDEQIKGSRR